MNRILTIASFLYLPFSNGALCTEPDTIKSIFEVLQRADYLEMTLELDFKDMLNHKMAKEYKPGKLSCLDESGRQQNWDIQVRPRGNMRLQVCSLPPLMLRFSKNELSQIGLNGHNTLKMVICCSDSKVFEQFVLREFLAYRLYNILTEYSFRVQLANVKIIDTGSNKAALENFAFIIEDDDELAERYNGKILPGIIASSRLLNTDECECFCIFQYMIGNTDWQMYSSHNSKLFGETGTLTPIPIPYDFDYSGLVSTPYAVPNDLIPILHVSERYYQGYCRPREDTQRTISLFLNKKEEILTFASQFPHFDAHSRKHVLKYLNSFYKVIENPKLVRREISQKCDRWLKPFK